MPIPMSIFWLILTIVFALLEAATLGLTAIWFAIGALVAMLAAVLGAPVVWQIVLFIIVSGAVLLFVRPLSKKYLKIGKEKTNADRVVSMEGIVLEPIDNEKAKGLVRVGGQIWTARSQNGEIIEKDKRVRVIEIQGVKLIVISIGERQEDKQ